MIIDGEEYVSLKEAAEILKSQNTKLKHTLHKLKRLTIKNKDYIRKVDAENLATFYKESELLRKELAQKKALIMAQYETERKLTTNKIEEIKKKYLNIQEEFITSEYIIFKNNFEMILTKKYIEWTKYWNITEDKKQDEVKKMVKKDLKKLRDIKVSPLSSSKVLILIAGKWTINYLRETAYEEIKTLTSLCNFVIKICTVQELTKIKYQVLYENDKT
ncbi:MAG: hypothetical protein FJX70_07640 [Alphaproteobacteria bacterium]|nr:hypothetical protein [Alphaproteobacteria bacterium]